MSLARSANALKALARQAPAARSYSALARRAATASISRSAPQFVVSSSLFGRDSARDVAPKQQLTIPSTLHRRPAESRPSSSLVSCRQLDERPRTRELMLIFLPADDSEVVYERSDWPLPKLQE